MSATNETIDQIFREEYGRVVASLVRMVGDLDVAEEAIQDALVVALDRWQRDGIPANPGGLDHHDGEAKGDRRHSPRSSSTAEIRAGSSRPADVR